ncbi:uracil-DNA glycosylase [Alkalicoccus chagannorensis]|uniref:uracil-DNA glycosylase n=1 Tax=Alkalicoccus chagannorensis TaxID=427072 RepID=UPI0006863314|nr:uracil-DNA glycosylase [Alkalicoccus chagannorensis]
METLIPESLAEQIRGQSQHAALEGFVYGRGPAEPKLMLIGEAPGETEVHSGLPFTGRAGKELTASLEEAGLSREEMYITSAVRSRPYRWGRRNNRDGTTTLRKYNRPPTKKEIALHAPLLDVELEQTTAPLLVTLGNVGLQRLIGKHHTISEQHGRLYEGPVLYWDGTGFAWTARTYKLLPTFHPASVFYNPSVREKVHADWQQIAHVLQQTTGRQKGEPPCHSSRKSD